MGAWQKLFLAMNDLRCSMQRGALPPGYLMTGATYWATFRPEKQDSCGGNAVAACRRMIALRFFGRHWASPRQLFAFAEPAAELVHRSHLVATSCFFLWRGHWRRNSLSRMLSSSWQAVGWSRCIGIVDGDSKTSPCQGEPTPACGRLAFARRHAKEETGLCQESLAIISPMLFLFASAKHRQSC